MNIAASLSNRRRRARGFTLIETVITVAVVGVLSGIAYPSFEGQVLRARRADALVALMQAQLAQERHRANNSSYGSLRELGLRPTSSAGHYTLEVTANDGAGYAILASATARQARDTPCRHLRLTTTGGTVAYGSGPDAATQNAADVNRRCWSQ